MTSPSRFHRRLFSGGFSIFLQAYLDLTERRCCGTLRGREGEVKLGKFSAMPWWKSRPKRLLHRCCAVFTAECCKNLHSARSTIRDWSSHRPCSDGHLRPSREGEAERNLPSRRRSRTNLNRSPIRHRHPHLLNLFICHRNASISPVSRPVPGSDPTVAVGQSMHKHIPAR